MRSDLERCDRFFHTIRIQVFGFKYEFTIGQRKE